MPRVFIPSVPSRYDPLSQRHIPTIDLSMAEAFGALVPLVDLDASLRDTHAIAELKARMREFESTDYILAAGDIVLVAAALAMACRAHGSAKVLRWDRLTRTYDCVEVNL